jgi:chromosome segregation ATPase
MAETIIESLARLEATAEVVKKLMERVTELEEGFEAYSSKATQTLKDLSWADTLPDRLRKIEETVAPLKEETDELHTDLIETAQKQKSSLDTLESSIKEMEQYFGIRN